MKLKQLVDMVKLVNQYWFFFSLFLEVRINYVGLVIGFWVGKIFVRK